MLDNFAQPCPGCFFLEREEGPVAASGFEDCGYARQQADLA
jgi:hypothetical protein